MLVELDEGEVENLGIEEKIWKIQNNRKVKMIIEEIIELEERFDTELVAVKSMKPLIYNLNNDCI